MYLSLNNRLTIAFLAALVGLIWQGVIVSLGGEASAPLITAFSSIMLATLGIGLKEGASENDNGKSTNANK